MPNHHPDETLLIEYAAGSLGEAKSLLVATHLTLCPQCRRAVHEGEVVAGVLLQGSTYEVAGGDPREPEAALTEVPRPHVSATDNPIPNPLRDYLGQPVSALRWTPVWRGLREYPLPQFNGGVRLLSIPGGGRMPRHTHDAEELTLVLQGSFTDLTGRYARGDVGTADALIDHRPRADRGQLCICLAVEDGALRLTGWTGRLFDTVALARSLLQGRRV
jgi:putative transcriptional regulator